MAVTFTIHTNVSTNCNHVLMQIELRHFYLTSCFIFKKISTACPSSKTINRFFLDSLISSHLFPLCIVPVKIDTDAMHIFPTINSSKTNIIQSIIQAILTTYSRLFIPLLLFYITAQVLCHLWWPPGDGCNIINLKVHIDHIVFIMVYEPTNFNINCVCFGTTFIRM